MTGLRPLCVCRIALARLGGLWLAGCLAGCVSTEPLSTPPHINLSPEQMSFTVAADEQLDFGLEVSRNESDSLENLEVLPGLRVRNVRGGSVAESAGIRAGDVILRINGLELNQPDTLASLAAASEARQFEVEARRGTTVYRSTMGRPRQRRSSAPEELYRADPLRSRAGYRTELAAGEQTVVRLVEIFPQSPLAEAGLQAGDVLLALDGEPIASAQGLVNRLAAKPFGARVNLTVLAQSEPAAAPRRLGIQLWQPQRRLSRLAIWPLFQYRSSLSEAQTRLEIIDLILFSLVSYERRQGEQTWRLLGIFEFGSGHGELLEDQP